MISREELTRVNSDKAVQPSLFSEEEMVPDPLQQESESAPEEDLPLERQLEEVDMENEDMDMLEWLVRRWIPIPKQYYWDSPEPKELPRRVKVWHNVVGSLGAATKFVDRIGKPVANAVQSTSRFDYVKNTMSERQIEISKRNLMLRKSQKEASRRTMQVEEGLGEEEGKEI